MSAFDIAGAAVATPLAFMYLIGSVSLLYQDKKGGVVGLFIGLIMAAWSVFCIARIFGAHL